MRNFKKTILPVLCVLVMLAAVNALMNYALIPYSYVRIMMHQVTMEEYDTVFLGTSHGLNGINPKVVEEKTGQKSINLCLGGEYPQDAYFLLKKVCEKGVPKTVVYELDPGYWCTQQGQRGDFNRLYYEMPWSVTKLQYFADKMLKLDLRASLFPWFYYRGQFENVKGTISAKQTQAYKEFCIPNPQDAGWDFTDGFVNNLPSPGTEKRQELTLWQEKDKNEESFRYFEKLEEFCRDKGIALVVIITPVPEETLQKYQDNYREIDAYFSSYMKEQGVLFWNYNLPERRIKGFDYSLNGYSDWEGHMDKDQAGRFSARLAKDLKKI